MSSAGSWRELTLLLLLGHLQSPAFGEVRRQHLLLAIRQFEAVSDHAIVDHLCREAKAV